MFMTHNSHEDWYSEGKIIAIDGWQVKIEFPNTMGKIIQGEFYSQSGIGHYLVNGYQTMPMSRPVANIDKTIAALAKEIDKMNVKKKEVMDAELAKEVAEDAALAAQEPLRLEDHAKKKSAQSSTTQETSQVANSSETASFVVSHKGVEADCKNRWCAGFENSLQAFGDGTSVNDIFHKDRNDRFRWFVDNTETAYNMFLDLVEKLVYDDWESGLLNDQFDKVVDDVDDDVDPEEDAKDAEAEKKAQEVAMMWEGYSCGG